MFRILISFFYHNNMIMNIDIFNPILKRNDK